jgi:hypothetical protein
LRLEKFCRQLSGNNNKNIFILKCDIKRFFDSIDQDILLELVRRRIQDEKALCLIEKIVKSFAKEKNKGLPLGNVTSQLFSNIYLNELDQFIKHRLKIRYYLRYCDDFVILVENENYLVRLIMEIEEFLARELKLFLHPNKIIIRKYHQGIDFLGYVVLPHYRVLRTKTKKRILKRISEKRQRLSQALFSDRSFNQSLQSYLGTLKHCKSYSVRGTIYRVCRQL